MAAVFDFSSMSDLDQRDFERISIRKRLYLKLNKLSFSENGQDVITRDIFASFVKTKQDDKIDRIFDILFGAETLKVPVEGMVESITNLLFSNSEVKSKFLFRILDEEDNGYLCVTDLLSRIPAVCNNSREQNLWQYARCVVDDYKKTCGEIEEGEEDNEEAEEMPEDNLRIDLAAFKQIICQTSLHGDNHLRAMFQVADTTKMSKKGTIKSYILYRWAHILFAICFIVINIIIALVAGSQYWNNSHVYIVFARMAGMLLNADSAFLLIFVSNRLMTTMRSLHLEQYIPVDHGIDYHVWTAVAVVVFSLIHTIMHLLNLLLVAKPALNLSEKDIWMWLFADGSPLGWFFHTAYLTGWLLLIVLLIIAFSAHPCMRRRGYFQTFFWLHKLVWVYYILLLLHSPRFWKWFLAPFVIYLIGILLRLKWINRKYFGQQFMKKATIYDSKVAFLQISRPKGFRFHVGDYIYVNIPAIAKYEWHPFTVSSCPEKEDMLFLHIRVVGHWTQSLYDTLNIMNAINIRDDTEGRPKIKLKKMPKTVARLAYLNRGFRPSAARNCPELETKTAFSHRRATVKEAVNAIALELENDPQQSVKINEKALKMFGKVYIDGPFGGAHERALEAEHTVLICTGIGVTPFAAILQSIFYRHLQQCSRCPECDTVVWQRPEAAHRMKKVDFFWINRESANFHWFSEILQLMKLSSLGEGSLTSFVGIHLFLTGVSEENYLQSLAIGVAHRILQQRHEREGKRGGQTIYSLGRPDWRWEFDRLREMRKGKIEVFFCGQPSVSKAIKILCREYGFPFTEDNF